MADAAEKPRSFWPPRKKSGSQPKVTPADVAAAKLDNALKELRAAHEDNNAAYRDYFDQEDI